MEVDVEVGDAFEALVGVFLDLCVSDDVFVVFSYEADEVVSVVYPCAYAVGCVGDHAVSEGFGAHGLVHVV